MPGGSLSPEKALELLRQARQLIRSRTRSPKYWTAGDSFCEMLLGKPFGTPPDFFKAAGSDLAAVLDSLYEDLAQQGVQAIPRVKEMTLALQRVTALDAATEALSVLETALATSGATLLDAAMTVCAVLVLRGHEELSRRVGTDAANEWLELWGETFWKHNSQQEAISLVGMLSAVSPNERMGSLGLLGAAPDDLVPVATTFSAGVREFLTKYGDTGAASVSLVGVMPFAEGLTAEEHGDFLRLIRSDPDFLKTTVTLLRFALDVNFDPTEVLNTGRFAYAAENRMNLIDGITSRGLIKAEIDAKLREEWAAYTTEAQARLAGVLTRNADAPGHRVLTSLVKTLKMLTNLLVSGT